MISITPQLRHIMALVITSPVSRVRNFDSCGRNEVRTAEIIAPGENESPPHREQVAIEASPYFGHRLQIRIAGRARAARPLVDYRPGRLGTAAPFGGLDRAGTVSVTLDFASAALSVVALAIAAFRSAIALGVCAFTSV